MQKYQCKVNSWKIIISQDSKIKIKIERYVLVMHRHREVTIWKYYFWSFLSVRFLLQNSNHGIFLILWRCEISDLILVGNFFPLAPSYFFFFPTLWTELLTSSWNNDQHKTEGSYCSGKQRFLESHVNIHQILLTTWISQHVCVCTSNSLLLHI